MMMFVVMLLKMHTVPVAESSHDSGIPDGGAAHIRGIGIAARLEHENQHCDQRGVGEFPVHDDLLRDDVATH